MFIATNLTVACDVAGNLFLAVGSLPTIRVSVCEQHTYKFITFNQLLHIHSFNDKFSRWTRVSWLTHWSSISIC